MRMHKYLSRYIHHSQLDQLNSGDSISSSHVGPSSSSSSAVPVSYQQYTLQDTIEVYFHCFQTDADYFFKDNQYDTQFNANSTKRISHPPGTNVGGNPMKHAGSDSSTNTGKPNSTNSKAKTGERKKSLDMLALTSTINSRYLGEEIYSRCKAVSNVWPYAILPMAFHSIYWLKKNSCPCLCVGIDINALRNNYLTSSISNTNSFSGNNGNGYPYIKVVPIDCSTPRRITLVTPSVLEVYKYTPCNLDAVLKSASYLPPDTSVENAHESNSLHGAGKASTTSSSEAGPSQRISHGYTTASTSHYLKTLDFVNAMIDFAICKLKHKCHQVASMEKLNHEGKAMGESFFKWFMYPKFIHSFFDDTQSWSKWRKQAERKSHSEIVPGKLSTRKLYLLALLETDKIENEAQKEGLMSQAMSLGLVNSVDNNVSKTNIVKYLNSFQWGENLYMLPDYPWEDELFLMLDDGVDSDNSEDELTETGENNSTDDDHEKAGSSDELSKPKGGDDSRTGDGGGKSKSSRGVSSKGVVKKSKATATSDGSQENSSEKNASVPAKRILKPPSTSVPMTKKPKKAPEPPPPPPPPVVITSPLNLYWVDRYKLPCVFYDEPGNEYADSFYVLPVNCVNYQYYTKVKRTQTQPLSEWNIGGCNDDKTREFGCALMDFANWCRTISIPATPVDGEVSAAGSPCVTVPAKASLFQWPDFVFELITKPKDWTLWRKQAVQKSGVGSVRVAYFQAMKDEYLATLAEDGV